VKVFALSLLLICSVPDGVPCLPKIAPRAVVHTIYSIGLTQDEWMLRGRSFGCAVADAMDLEAAAAFVAEAHQCRRAAVYRRKNPNAIAANTPGPRYVGEPALALKPAPMGSASLIAA
jgi:hypothetical protein